MRETRADTRVAVVAAIVLHAVLFVLMFAGMWWTRAAAPVSAAGPVIEADLVDPNALSAPLRRALDAPALPPEPEPEPAIEPEPVRPEPAPEPEPPPPDTQPQPQERIPEPDTREQERVEREAEAARQAAHEQEEKLRQEQIDLTERKRQQEAERKQREIARKLEAIRAEQAKAKRAAELAEQKLRQIEDAKRAAAATSAAPPPPGNEGVDPELASRYAAALTEAILRNWTRPESVPLGQRCVIVIRQVAGGTVIDAKVDPSCPYDELGRRSVEAAVLKAQPLPYAGFEAVFNRNLRLNFEAADR